MHDRLIHNLSSWLSGPCAGGPACDLSPGEARSGAGVSGRRAGVNRFLALRRLLLVALMTFVTIGQASGAAVKIINNARLDSRELLPVTTSVTVTNLRSVPAAITLFQYGAAAPGVVPTMVPLTPYRDGGVSGGLINPLPPTLTGRAAPLDLSVPLPLLPTKTLHAGDPLFISVDAPGSNVDDAAVETILVTVTDVGTHDLEVVQLTETGPATGVFFGFLMTTLTTTGSYSGTLSVVDMSRIIASFNDPMNGNTQISADALVDPAGIVFDSLTGAPVDGARVDLFACASLTDCSGGTPATVFGDDGVSAFPATLVTGSTVTDAAGRSYAFRHGGFRFPYLVPGYYQLRVTPPVSYTFPSTVSDPVLQALPGAPFNLLTPGSKGEPFAIPAGPVIRLDVPIDPIIGTLWVKKSAGRPIVSAGEFLTYDVTVENSDPVGNVFAATVTDTLPAGFSYRKGSTRIGGAAAPDPAVSADGRTLTYRLGTLPPRSATTIHYVVAVGAGAVPGQAVNTASVSSTPAVTANTARAFVTVQEPFMQSRSILMGRVTDSACGADDDGKYGLSGVAVYLEDGTFVLTDKRGMFHFEGVAPGVHVVQLDLDSLPEGYDAVPCEKNSRFAGRAYSQFVDVQGGVVWRTDFHVAQLKAKPTEETDLTTNTGGKSAASAGIEEDDAEDDGDEAAAPAQAGAPVGHVSLEMLSSRSDRTIEYRIPITTSTMPLANLRLAVALPEGVSYESGSSSATGAGIPDPERDGTALLYRLGAAEAESEKEVRFRGTVTDTAKAGDLHTVATLRFDSPVEKDLTAPPVENILTLAREELYEAMPTITLRPHFPTFGAELDPDDTARIDEVVKTLAGLSIDKIEVVGHTDTVRIAPRSRRIYRDNVALSLARAKSVGHYLMNALHLPPSSLEVDGKGAAEPVATNRTRAGKGLNRRVEVRVLVRKRIVTTTVDLKKERSGLQRRETWGAAAALPAAPTIQALPGPAPPVQHAAPTQRSAGARTTVAATPAAPATLAVIPDNDSELFTAQTYQQEEAVTCRLRYRAGKGSAGKLKVLITLPKNLLYVNGASLLNLGPVADPVVKDNQLEYSLDNLPDGGKIELAVQLLADGAEPVEGALLSARLMRDGADRPLTAESAVTNSVPPDDGFLIPPAPPQQPVAAKDPPEETERPRSTGSPKATGGGAAEITLQVLEQDGLLSPADTGSLALRINPVRVVLDSSLTPRLTLDGAEVAAERIGFAMKDTKSGKSLYTYIGVEFGEPGEHRLRLQGIDPFGNVRFDREAKVFRTGDIARIRLVSTEGNIADGKTPVKVRIQLFDKNDKPVQANFELAVKGGDLLPTHGSSAPAGAAGGMTVPVDSDGWVTFSPVTGSGLYRFSLAHGTITVDGDTYVKPRMRNWILVGVAEGTVGHGAVANHAETLPQGHGEEDFYENGRVAFYAKGTIKGEWLLTMAYDSAKSSTGAGGNSLFQTINPNAYYTIYGDGSTQNYDAPSARKLYIKIEREQFQAMFGDYDTGLTVTELSRYSRKLNGVKADFNSRNVEVRVFGSETPQAFAKDEIPGDGTSFLYRLTRTGIVPNSETITIEVRDRFKSELVLSSKQLTRFIDYSIDYDTGALFFKSPVPHRENFNPVYIVADYETNNGGSSVVTAGGRAAVKVLDNRMIVGGTYVREGQQNGSNQLAGADVVYQVGEGTKARGEIAVSNNDAGVTRGSGSAYLAELAHTDKKVDAKAYYRQQDEGFGVGQQKGSETGTRKFGAEGAYKLSETVTIGAQGYQQDTLATGARRDLIEANAGFADKVGTANVGVRETVDHLGDGTSHESSQLLLGGSRKMLNDRLTLRLNHEQSLGGRNDNTDFPTRTIIGADYLATKTVSLFAQEELTFGSIANTDTTKIGVKGSPWDGGTFSTAMEQDHFENSDRLFAILGLTQKWQITRHWAVDGGVERSQTIKNKQGYTLNVNVPPASGGEDYTAVSLGGNYQDKKLLWSNRLEFRDGETIDKWGIMSGITNEMGPAWGWTGRLQLFHSSTPGGTSRDDAEIRLGAAYRPALTKIIFLDRLDLIEGDDKSATSSTKSHRLVNNLNANFKPDKKTQVSLQYGAKYVVETIDGNDYSGFTDLIGLEGRHDFTDRWDVGLRGAILHTWSSGQCYYSAGPSVGYNVMENLWVSIGYNVVGFSDKDFSSADYTSQGPFMKFRFKFDQNSIRDALNWTSRQ